MPTDETYHDEKTLVKVYEALLKNGIYGQKAVDLVSDMQNAGILFREIPRKKRGRPAGSRNKPKEEERPEKDPQGITAPVMETAKAWEPRTEGTIARRSDSFNEPG